MMKLINKSASVFALCGLYATAALSTEIVHYKNVPVTIELRKGEERSIQFGDHVQVGVTKGQQMKKLFRVQSAQGGVHILPHQEFDKQRVQIKRMGDGRVILLDFIAGKPGHNSKPLEEVKILLPSENVIVEQEEETSMAMDMPVITPVDLTRFASQRLYGPNRLHKDVRGISEASLRMKSAVKVFKGQNKHKTASRPVVAYQGGGYYVTGIHIKNTSHDEVKLDYLDINLPFTHATFQHHALNPNGTPGDSTVLYLISDESMKETLYPWTYYMDIKAEKEARLAKVKQKQYEDDKDEI